MFQHPSRLSFEAASRRLRQEAEARELSDYEPRQTIAIGSLVHGRDFAPLEIRSLEGVVIAYDMATTAIVRSRSGDEVRVNDALLTAVTTERPEVGDHVAINEYQPADAGEIGVVEIVGMMTGEVQIRTPDGRLLSTWPCCCDRDQEEERGAADAMASAGDRLACGLSGILE